MRNVEMVDSQALFSSMLPKEQEWFSPKETGYIIGRSDQFVRDCFTNGKIMGHSSNALALKGEEKRSYLRVHRDAIILYLLESANYTSESYIRSIEEILKKSSDYQLLRFEKVIKDILYKRRRTFDA